MGGARDWQIKRTAFCVCMGDVVIINAEARLKNSTHMSIDENI